MVFENLSRGIQKLTKRQVNLIKKKATRYKLNTTQIKNKQNLPMTPKHFAHILLTFYKKHYMEENKEQANGKKTA